MNAPITSTRRKLTRIILAHLAVCVGAAVAQDAVPSKEAVADALVSLDVFSP